MLNAKKRPKVFIGVDPAFRKDGFYISIIDLHDRSVQTKCFGSFLDFCSWFLHDSPGHAVIGIENSNLQDETFITHKDKKTGKPLTKWQARRNPRAVPLSAGEAASISRKAGKNQAASQYTVDLCRSKYKVLELSPLQKGEKWNQAQFIQQMKMNKLTFMKDGKSNQDERDATKCGIIVMNRWYEAK